MMEYGEMENPQGQSLLLTDLHKNWGWILALGVLFVVLGIIGLGMTVFLTLVTVLYFGILLIVGGGIQLVKAFRAEGHENLLLHLVVSVLYGLAGVIIIAHPKLASAIFTALLAGILIVQGVLRAVWGLRLRAFVSRWFWPFVGGMLSILLGLIILVHWPVSGLWVIGLFIAVEMIVQGWTYIILAMAVRSAS